MSKLTLDDITIFSDLLKEVVMNIQSDHQLVLTEFSKINEYLKQFPALSNLEQSISIQGVDFRDFIKNALLQVPECSTLKWINWLNYAFFVDMPTPISGGVYPFEINLHKKTYSFNKRFLNNIEEKSKEVFEPTDSYKKKDDDENQEELMNLLGQYINKPNLYNRMLIYKFGKKIKTPIIGFYKMNVYKKRLEQMYKRKLRRIAQFESNKKRHFDYLEWFDMNYTTTKTTLELLATKLDNLGYTEVEWFSF